MTPEPHVPDPMTPNWRKPVGMLLILLLLGIWCVVIVTIADAAALPIWAALIVYVAAGIAWLWVLPMRRMLFWVEHGRWR